MLVSLSVFDRRGATAGTGKTMIKADSKRWHEGRLDRVDHLFGAAGTGKTMMAKAIARQSGARFINLSQSSIQNKW